MVKTDTSLSSSEGTAPRPGLEMDDMDKLASAVVHFKIPQFLPIRSNLVWINFVI